MTCRIHFSGTIKENTGPAMVNRAYLARCLDWLRGTPEGPSPANTWRFLRLHREFSGVLVSSTSGHHLILMLLARVLRRDAWYLAHGVARVEMRINRTTSIKHFCVEALTVRLATGVICVSETLREQLSREFPSTDGRLYVVQNGSVDQPRVKTLTPKPPSGVVRLMTVGTKPIKNLATLCTAIAEAALDSVELVVVGELEADDGWVGDLPFVHHLPRLTHDETLAWMAASDIYVQVSLYETFGLAVCEAAQQGCELLLTTTVGCAPIIPTLRDHNLVADPHDAVLIASRLRHLVALARTGATTQHECTRTWNVAAAELQGLLCPA